MSNYLVELSLIHLVLILGYWLFLRNERQYHKMRFYLLGATLLALTIPLLKLPRLFNQKDPLIGDVITLDATAFTPTPEVIPWYHQLLIGVYAAVSLFLLVKFVNNLYLILRLKRQSSCQKFNDLYIHKVRDYEGSFTFLHWIFLNEDIDENREDYQAIVKHEKAHADLGHTYDLLFLELFKVCFWWLPSAWFINNEIRKIQEYQADAYALKWCHIDRYSNILVNSTLKLNGLSLASSFHDGLILKRLNAMKQKAKSLNPWKLGVLSLLCTLLIVVFACTEDMEPQSNEQANESSLATEGEVFDLAEELPHPVDGMSAFYEYVSRELKYPEQARRNGIEGRVYVQFVVEKDGSLSQIEALKGIGAGCDQEAVRVLQSAPAFKPGTQRGKPIRVRMQLPVTFRLNHGKTNPDNTTQGMIIPEEVESKLNLFKVDARFEKGIWSGTIYDEQGGGLPGANIVVAGTNTGTVSNLDGSFQIKAGESDQLQVSFVGYKTVKVANE